KVETPHHFDELPAIALLQSRVLLHFLTERRVIAVLVLVRRIDFERRVQTQEVIEQTVMQSFGVTRWEVAASGCADEKRIPCEYVILNEQAHRIACMPRRMHHLGSQRAERDRFPVAEAHIDEGRRTRLVHHDRNVETLGELTSGGEMIRMRMRIDQVTEA